MAGRKEYTMLFSLNASMNGNFSGTFSKAQQEFSRLGGEIKSLQKVQSDISGYQKQERAVSSTSAKLANLQQQHDLLQKEIRETTGSTAGLEREKVRLEQRIRDTETALEGQKQKLEATGTRLKEAGVDTNNLAQQEAELTARIRELSQQQERAAEGAASFGDMASQGIAAAGEAIAAAGIAQAMHQAAEAFRECVGIAADFEEAMSTVEALSGAGTQEMAALTTQAKELGATTKFTAKESADAMGYMAMAGWDAADMLQGMDGVLQLAAASGEDLALVSDIVTDSLSAFGLKAEDTAHFSDVLAAAATNANTNVAIMGETFKQSASVAGALGYTIEDMAVAVGLMANSGVKGSIGGTALKNTFNGLLEGVTLTGAAFGEYEYSAIKADGTMKSFGSTIDELRGYFAQMTEAERVNNAMTIAGQRGYNGLLAILNATDADYASLTGSINDCSGAARKMAEIKLDNLNGQLTLMDSAIDALKTTIGEQFNPELRALAETGTNAFTWANEFVQENPALVKGVMAAGAALGTLAVGITGVTAAMQLASVAGGLFAGTMGVALGPVAAVAAGIAGVVGVVTALTAAANESVPPVRELTEAAREMQTALDEAGASFEQTTDQTQATVQAAGLYIDRLEELESAQGESAAAGQEYQNTLALLLRTMPELAGHISQTTDEYGRTTYALESGTQALRDNLEQTEKNARVQAHQQYINTLYDNYGKVLLAAEEHSIKLTEAQMRLDRATEGRSAAQARMNELSTQAYANGTALTEEYYELATSLDVYSDTVRTSQKEVENYSQALKEDEAAVTAAKAAIEDAEAAVEQYTGVTQAQTDAEAAAAAQTEALNTVIGNTAEQVAVLVQAYYDAYDAALESVSGQYDLWDKAAKVAETSVGNINAALESQSKYWQDYNNNLQSLSGRTGDIEGLSAVIASFADGSAESVNAVAGLASATDDELKAMVKNWQEVQWEQEAVAGSLAEIQTGMSASMDELGQALAEDIEGMNLSDEAKKAGRETIRGYVDAANEMLPQVQAAYKALADAAVASIGLTRFEQKEAGIHAGAESRPQPGFAAGTASAPPGWAWVGEEGPELMRLRGGETILPAEISREFALLTVYQDKIAAYAGGTDDAPDVVAEYLPYTAQKTARPVDLLTQTARLNEIVNHVYAAYHNVSDDHSVVNAGVKTENVTEELTEIVNHIHAAYAAYHSIVGNHSAVSNGNASTFSSAVDMGAKTENHTENLTGIVNRAYANYSNAVYNTGAHNVIRQGDYTYTAIDAPQQTWQTAPAGLTPVAPAYPAFPTTQAVLSMDAMPDHAGGGDAPITVNVHFHIEGSATPETVDDLREYVENSEFKERVREVFEEIKADAKRESWS